MVSDAYGVRADLLGKAKNLQSINGLARVGDRRYHVIGSEKRHSGQLQMRIDLPGETRFS